MFLQLNDPQCLCLTLDPVWSKKKKLFPGHCAKKVLLFWLKKKKGNTVHLLHQQTTAEIKCHCSSSTTTISSGAPAISSASANHSGKPTTTEKTIASAHRSTLIYYLRHRSATPPQQTFSFSNQTSITNHQPQPPKNPPQPAPTGVSPQQGQRNRSSSATIHSALAFSNDNGSTGPRLTATSQTSQPFPRTADPKQNHRSTYLALSPSAVATNYRRQGRRKQKLSTQNNSPWHIIAASPSTSPAASSLLSSICVSNH